MKLLRCYVQNYGKLHEFEYNFKDDLNIILQDNGWGKSTFASFIKSMLFGLPATTKRDLDENERAKYTPWQGGKFGGWLEFTLKNKPYRIERFFGSTQSRDTTIIYDLTTNNPLPDNDFIEKSLGINADTFMRSTYIEQGIFSNANDENIKSKLGKLIKNEDTIDLSQVDEKLLAKQTSLQLLRGKGGQIYNVECELDNTRKLITQCEQAKKQTELVGAQIAENQKKIDEINAQINILRSQVQFANDERTAYAVYQHFESIKNDLTKLQAEQNEIIQFFKGTPPTKQQLDDLSQLQREYNNAKSALDNFGETNNNYKVTKLNEYFANGVPTEQELTKANNDLLTLNKMENNLNFSHNVIEKSNSPIKLVGLGISCLGGLLAVLAILFGILNVGTSLAIIFGVIGVIILAIGIGTTLWGNRIYKTPAKITAQNNINNNSAEIARIKENLTFFVLKYKENPANLDEALYNIKFNYKSLQELEQDKYSSQDRKEQLQKTLNNSYTALVQFYGEFFNPADKFSSNYDIIKSQADRLNYISKQCEEKEQMLIKFAEQNNIDTNKTQSNQSTDINQLNKRIAELEYTREEYTNRNNELNSRLITFSDTADSLGFYETKEKELEENLAKLKNDLELIKNTRKYLEIAKNNLTSKYLTPLSDAFMNYAKKFIGNSFGNVSINTNLEIKIEQQGEQKQTKYFSHGVRDIIELCMRLALIKAVFEDELPPLIMDDPFYNLDDKKTENGLKLLSELSEEFQIVYLVCHSSRA